MTTIWKYNLPVTDEQVVSMPEGAEILHVASQFGDAHYVQVWALVTPDNEPEERKIRIFGTGHPVPDQGLWHLGTAITASGYLVWHVFEQLPGEWAPSFTPSPFREGWAVMDSG